jgi:hypothetical protein
LKIILIVGFSRFGVRKVIMEQLELKVKAPDVYAAAIELSNFLHEEYGFQWVIRKTVKPFSKVGPDDWRITVIVAPMEFPGESSG